MDFEIENMSESDWGEVREIYVEGIATGNATFETTAPTWEAWNASHLTHSRIVARSGSTVIGWAALSPVSSRCIYGGVAEVSIYVGEKGRGNGVGNSLLRALIESSESKGIWTLQAGIFPENEASRRLHLKNGFRKIGYRERIGKHGDAWRDNVLFERRSVAVGTD
jgi:L-amino acid N-acyltransferase YncA